MSTILLSDSDVEVLFGGNWPAAIGVVESALLENHSGKTIFPEKISQIFDEKTQNRINCMPATLIDKGVSGVKWVSVFPENPKSGVKNVNGIMLLSEIGRGLPLAVMGAGTLTSLRTAAVGATAAKHLAPAHVGKIAFIGAGAEARRHFSALTALFPEVNVCAVSARGDSSAKEFARWARGLNGGVAVEECGNDFERAVSDADIIVTATSAQAPLLKSAWVKPGSLYIHVGGWKDEYAVAQNADLIVCDDWNAVKHRGSQTLSRAFKAGCLDEGRVRLLQECLLPDGLERHDGETVYFNSVGLSFIDVAFANYFYAKARNAGGSECFDFCR